MVQSLLNMPLRKSSDSKPQISQVTPPAAIAGGELQIRGKGFAETRPAALVTIGEVGAPVIIGSDSLVIARVPEGATAGELVIESGGQSSESWACDIGVLDRRQPASGGQSRGRYVRQHLHHLQRIARPEGAGRGLQDRPELQHEAVHQRADERHRAWPSTRRACSTSPAATTASSTRSRPTATCRSSWRAWASPPASRSTREQNLYVGDRSGTIFKISPNRQIFVFATLEPSIAAYHLRFGPDGYLYVTGPTTSSFDSVYRISHAGEVEVFYRGLGRPQGMAFDEEGRLYVAASIAGRKGVVRISPDRRAELFLSGPGIVGLAFTPVARPGGGHHQRALSRRRRHQGPPARLMNAEIIAVGSEMLTPQRVDTNSLYLTAELNNLGVEVVTKSVIGDDRERLADAIRRAVSPHPRS